jgi:hypothetical protein
MTTNNKDFVVKNGLFVNNGGTFNEAVTVGTPTENTHATTKLYVDTAIGNAGGGSSVVVGGTEPENPSNGDFWLDTNIDRIKVFYSDSWIVLATYQDSQAVTQHTHDTSIEGTGFVIDVFTDSPQIGEAPVLYLDGGTPTTSTFDLILDGGNV